MDLSGSVQTVMFAHGAVSHASPAALVRVNVRLDEQVSLSLVDGVVRRRSFLPVLMRLQHPINPSTQS